MSIQVAGMDNEIEEKFQDTFVSESLLTELRLSEGEFQKAYAPETLLSEIGVTEGCTINVSHYPSWPCTL